MDKKATLSITSLGVKLAALGLAAFFFYEGEYAYALFALPVFLLDLCIPRTYSNDGVMCIFKLFLLCQGFGLWYLNSVRFFDVPANDIQNALFHEQFDWQNTTSTLRRIGQHTIQNFVSGPIHANSPMDRHSQLYPVKIVAKSGLHNVNDLSAALINASFGSLPQVDFPDLRYYSKEQIQKRFPRIFAELPSQGFDARYKNPCWHQRTKGTDAEGRLACLPYAYILGQPKSGTSDLYERMKSHSDIIMPTRKEVRWFTRGEFARAALPYEGVGGGTALGPTVTAQGSGDSASAWEGTSKGEHQLGSQSSIYSFTRAFRDLTGALVREGSIEAVAQALITVDGGPHTLWWPTQSPDGSFLLDVPTPQLLRELQPDAKFIITLNDPVRRMYSDYYFLHDSLKPLRPGMHHNKSGEEFHHRAIQQVEAFEECVRGYTTRLKGAHGLAFYKNFADTVQVPPVKGDPNFPIWFRAAQMCAHDRNRFAVGGWGRLSIGLYALFLEKWLEHFAPDQFLVVRLEDYEADPRSYMAGIFRFLDLAEPDDWTDILRKVHFNSHKVTRDPIWPQTEQRLRAFYRPFNQLLAGLLDNDKFEWDAAGEISLHDSLLLENHQKPAHTAKRSHNTHGELHAHDAADPPEAALHDGNGREDEAEGVEEGEEEAVAAALEKHTMVHASSKRDKANLRKRLADHGKAAMLVEKKEGDPIVDAETMKLTPHSFAIDDLPQPPEPLSEERVKEIERKLSSAGSAADLLCSAAFTLDLALVQYLLYEVGVPASLASKVEAGRNALHCLTLLYTLADAHSRSHVFAMLKGHESWLNKHFDPSLELKAASVLSRDITSSLERDMLVVARWLVRAGTPVNQADVAGWTPLHFSSMGGQVAVAAFLLESGADANAENRNQRTPLHLAVALGHAELAAKLIEKGADPNRADQHDMRPIEVLQNPGPISPGDAMRFFNLTQRPARQIDRLLHPELHSEDIKRGWRAGTGGWSPSRLPGYETNMSCERIDQYWADEITAEDLFHKYLARNTPVLIRGLLSDWKTVEMYTQKNLLRDHGDLKVQVSDIPYSEKFGSDAHVDRTLGEYIEEVKQHRMEGGAHPWYVFKGNAIPKMSDEKDSLVRIQDCPTPKVIQGAFEKTAAESMRNRGSGVEARRIFVNAQWALGGEGTGAPVHYHNSAWSSLIYGAKLWMVYPPHNMIMSNKQVRDFTETDLQAFAARGIPPLTCVQTAGDVLIIPESWGHGVLNLQESVAMATEAKTPLFRMSPGTKLFNKHGAAPPRPPRKSPPAAGNA